MRLPRPTSPFTRTVPAQSATAASYANASRLATEEDRRSLSPHGFGPTTRSDKTERMSVLGDLRAAARLTASLGPFLRDRITPARAREILRRRLDAREDRFLRLLERGVFGHARSPYRALL